MARIKTYAIDVTPTVEDKVIGTNVDNQNLTQNYTIQSIIDLVPGGSSSVQSLNTLTGELNLLGTGGITITASGTDITIDGSGSGGGGITSVDGATGPAIDLAGKGGITITAVGNLINIDGSGISGGSPGGAVNDVQYHGTGGVFAGNNSNTYTLSGAVSNHTLGMGEISGQLTLETYGVGDSVNYGNVKLEHRTGNYVHLAGSTSGEVSDEYYIHFPQTRYQDKHILESDANGQLSWIPTPSGGGGGTVTQVTGTAPVGVTTGTTPVVSMAASDGKVDGYLTTTDYNTFDGKQNALVSGTNIKTINNQSLLGSGNIAVSSGGGTVTNVTASLPLESTEGTTPALTIKQSSKTEDGYLSSSDFTTFDQKQAALISGTNIKTVNSQSLVGSGNVAITATPGGGASQIQYNNASSLDGDARFTLNPTNTITTVTIGNSTNPAQSYGLLKLTGDNNTEGGKIQFETGAGKGSPVLVTLQAPSDGAAQTISLPDTVPTADTQILGIKSISGTTVETQWETPTGGGGGLVTQLSTSGTSGQATLSGAGVLNVPVYDVSLPYKSYIATFIVAGGGVSEDILENDTGTNFTWDASGTPGEILVRPNSPFGDEKKIFVLCNGFGQVDTKIVQVFFKSASVTAITLNILDNNFTVGAADISAGNIEIRVY